MSKKVEFLCFIIKQAKKEFQGAVKTSVSQVKKVTMEKGDKIKICIKHQKDTCSANVNEKLQKIEHVEKDKMSSFSHTFNMGKEKAQSYLQTCKHYVICMMMKCKQKVKTLSICVKQWFFKGYQQIQNSWQLIRKWIRRLPIYRTKFKHDVLKWRNRLREVKLKDVHYYVRRLNVHRGGKRVFASALAIAMTFTILPAPFVEVMAATASAESGYTTDSNGIMSYRYVTGGSSYSTFDIHGKVNNTWLKTTYGNNGYQGAVDGSSNVQLVKTEPEFINNGRYIKLNYTVKNIGSSIEKFHMSVDADIMIGGDDYATIRKFDDNTGFKMENNRSGSVGYGAQFNFYGKGAYGVDTDVSTYWFGYYSNRSYNRYNNVYSNELTNTDSGMACSWQNQQIPANGTKKYSVIIGIGEASAPPKIDESNVVVPDEPVAPGENIEVEIPIAGTGGDTNTNNMTIFYKLEKLDGTTIYGPEQITNVVAEKVTDNITKFIATFKIPENMPTGQFNLKVYAMNKAGAISAQITKVLEASASPPVIQSISSDMTTTWNRAVTLRCTAMKTGSLTLKYQWQKLISGSYSDISGATSAEYAPKVDEVGTSTYRCVVNYENDLNKVYSGKVNVTVNKATTTTALDYQLGDLPTDLTLKATITSDAGVVANGTVDFYVGSVKLKTENVVNGKATATISSESLSTGTMSLRAIYSGNAQLSTSTSSTKSAEINLKQVITYNDDKLTNDANLLRYYTEGILTVLKNPSINNPGYEFIGWMNQTNDMISQIAAIYRGSITLTPVWKSLKYTVLYTENLDRDKSVTELKLTNDTVTRKAETKSNYTFSKWSSPDNSIALSSGDASKDTITFTMPKRDVWLMATYTPNKYDITYANCSDASNSNPTKYTYGTSVSLAEPYKENAIFKGWYSDAALTTEVSEITPTTSGNMTLYAKWINLKTLTIKNVITKQSLVMQLGVGDNVMVPGEDVTGYTFLKWNVVSGTATISDPTAKTLSFSMPNENITVEAQYKANEYRLTYELDGGQNNSKNPATYEYGTTFVFNAPTKEGYSFLGWYTDAALTTNITAIKDSHAEDFTLYAKWKKNAYQVNTTDAKASVSGNQGTSLQVQYGDVVTLIPESKAGYSFIGWDVTGINKSDITSNNTFVMPNTAVSVKANYQKMRYTITYPNSGAEVSDTSKFPTEYVYGYNKVLTAPVKEGFNFINWYTDDTYTTAITSITDTMTGNLTLYAKYSANEYGVSIIDGLCDSKTDFTSTYNTTISVKSNIKTGMHVDHWLMNGEKINDTSITRDFIVPAKNIVIQPVYVANEYAITYDLNADTANPAIQGSGEITKYRYGDSKVLPNPTRTGYAFNGWISDGKTYTTITPEMEGDLALQADWKAETYTITYEGIDGADNKNALTGSDYSTAGQAQEIPLQTPIRTGYNFTGWELKNAVSGVRVDNETQKVILDQGTTSDFTLVAQWSLKEYSYNLEDSSVQTKTMKLDAPNIALSAQGKTGMKFKQWKANGNVLFANANAADTTFTFTAEMAKQLDESLSLNITAIYEPAEFKITYTVPQHAVNNNPTSFTYQTETILKEPSLEGYAFNKWTINSVDTDRISATTAEDVTAVASFHPIDYKVQVQDGQGGTTTAQIKDTITITADERDGYLFTGWSLVSGDATFADSSTKSTSFTMTAGDVAVKANYVADTYAIKYTDENDVDVISENPMNYTVESNTFELSEANRDGYCFDGWYSDKNFADDKKVTKIEKGNVGNLQLYAKFTVIKDTVTFDIRGQGTYTITSNGATVPADSIRDHVYEADRYSDIRVTFRPAQGYILEKILLDDEEITGEDTIRIDRIASSHVVSYVLSGKPTAVLPETSGENAVKWAEWTDISTAPSTKNYHKNDFEIAKPEYDETQTTLQYQISDANTAYNEANWVDFDETNNINFTGKTDGEYRVYLKNSDSAGNATISVSDKIVLDSIAPVINGLVNGTHIYTDTAFTITDQNPYKVKVNQSEVTQLKLAGNVNDTYEITVSDMAGNTVTIEVQASTLDSLLEDFNDISKDAVNSTHKATLQDALTKLQGLTTTDASADQMSYINLKTKTINEMLNTIEKVAQDIASCKNINTIEDKADAKQNMDKIMETYDELLSGNHLSEEERASLDGETYEAALGKQEYIDYLAELNKLAQLNANNVTTADRDKLQDFIDFVENLVTNGKLNTYLNEQQMMSVEGKANDMQTLVDKIDEVSLKMEELKNELDNIHISTITKNDQLDEIHQKYEDFLNTYEKNLTKDEKSDMTTQKDQIQEVSDIIDAIEKRLEDSKTNLKDKDKETIKDSDRVVVDGVLDTVDFVKDNVHHLDESLEGTFEEIANKVKELDKKLDDLAKEKAKVEKAKPKGTINDDNLNAYKDYIDKLNDLLTKYKKNLTPAQLAAFTKEKASRKSVLEAWISFRSIQLDAKLQDNEFILTAKGFKFEEGTRIQVKKINATLSKSFKDLVEKNLALLYPDGTIHEIYDISLVANKQKVQPDGMVEVRIKLSDAQKQYKGIGIVFIDKDGSITEIPCTVKDGYVIFNTNHFSNYAIIEKANGNSTGNGNTGDVKTGDTSENTMFTVSMLLSFVVLVSLKKRRKESL